MDVMGAGLEVEPSRLGAGWLRFREKADSTSSGVLVSRLEFAGFVREVRAGHLVPVARGGLIILTVGDADPERPGRVVTTPDSWRAFLTRVYAGDFDRFCRM
ncbi:hypothetical protein DP939_12870 [Spongiactinospora rosea]|uniref:Uncharacterized protein n=1 Tax=Spongiactinospora rosea TaxID=2248750 RepID=A0A366M1X5_9ACTN|nr:hypothetical protein [Spongiactinospora rosea]RBQ19629.1 hypothetical protein DP939_12870 [Spongiactinospora rosea]